MFFLFQLILKSVFYKFFPDFQIKEFNDVLLSIFAGIIFGFIVSMPPLGPVIFAVISKGLHNKNHEGLTIGMGAAFVDGFYAASAVGGIALIISLLPKKIIALYAANEMQILLLLSFLGGSFVCMYGVKILLSKKKIFSNASQPDDAAQEMILVAKEKQATDFMHKTKSNVEKFSFLSVLKNIDGNGRKQLVTGMLLCFSSITLPASWMAIAGVLKSQNIIEHTFRGGVLFAAGVFLGTYGWFFLLLKIIVWNKHKLGIIALRNLQLFSGIILIALGSSVIISALVTTMQ